MAKKHSNDPSMVDAKYSGSTDQRAKSISVQRPLESDEKTVIETHLEPVETPEPPKSKPAKKSATKKSAALNTAATLIDTSEPTTDETVLELPPSPGQRRARRRKIFLIWLMIIAVLGTGGWALLFFSPILAIEEIHYEGLDWVAASEAEQRTAGLIETPLPQVTNRSVTELFADHPAVDQVTVRAEPPHGLVVTVHEYTPVAMSPSGEHYVVLSQEGTHLAKIPAKRAEEFDLPVVASASDVVDQEVFDSITAVLGSLPEELRDQVRAASGSSIDSIELELASGKMVMWGNSAQANKKSQVLEALLGLDEDQAAEISEYDVSAPDFPVTR